MLIISGIKIDGNEGRIKGRWIASSSLEFKLVTDISIRQ